MKKGNDECMYSEVMYKKHRDTAFARHKYLTRVLKNVDSISDSVVKACETQRTFSHWDNSDQGIFSIRSLNTLKASAQAALGSNGWEELDKLRRQVREVGRSRRLKETCSRTSARQAQSKKIKELTLKLNETQRARAILNIGYFDLRSKLIAIAKSDEFVGELLKKHDSTFSGQLGLRVIKGDKDVKSRG